MDVGVIKNLNQKWIIDRNKTNKKNISMNNIIQKLVSDYVGNKSKINVRNINWLGDNKWMAKYRREKEPERMEDEEGISVTELKERIEEYYKSKGL